MVARNHGILKSLVLDAKGNDSQQLYVSYADSLNAVELYEKDTEHRVNIFMADT